MGVPGKNDKGKREQKKKPKLTIKEKRKLKHEKKSNISGVMWRLSQVKDLLRQARDLVKFIPYTPSATAEMKNEAKNIFEEADQANNEI